MQSVFAVIQFHLWPVRLYHIFPRYLINGTIFGKKISEYEMFVLIFLTILSQIFSILRRPERYIIINVHGSLCKVTVIRVRFSWNLNFLDRFPKKLNYILWKSVQWELNCSMRTERHESTNSRISQYCKAAQKSDSPVMDREHTGYIG